MNVELNLEELELIVEALNQKQNALNGDAAVPRELQAVNRLCNRLRQLGSAVFHLRSGERAPDCEEPPHRSMFLALIRSVSRSPEQC